MYDILQEQLKDTITVFKNLADVPPVELFPDHPDCEILFVCDDIVNEKDKKEELQELQELQELGNYYAFSRKNTFFLTQRYYHYQQSYSYVIIPTISIKSNNDLKILIRELATKDIPGDAI